MENKNITFVIFTYNEEARIERVIKNLMNYGKVLLNDDGSTDRTREIAESYGCEVMTRGKTVVFVETQEVVDTIYEKVTTDWIYWGFADEMLDKVTLEHLQNAIASNKYSIISIDRKNYFYGEFCYNLFNSSNFRAFKKGAIDFKDNVIHGMGRATVDESSIYKMPEKYFVHHFISNTATSYINVINNYTNSEYKSGKKANTSFFSFLMYVVKYLALSYLKGKFYKSKFEGLAFAEFMFIYALVKNIKQYECINGLDKQRIEEKNNIKRNEILLNLNQ